jgi:membrane-bound lytic murein transglycosylase D
VSGFWLALLALLAGVLLWPAERASAQGALPRPAALKPDIRFWRRVFAEIDSRAGFVHDDRHLEVVYEVLRFPAGATPAEESAMVDAARRRYQSLLVDLGRALGAGRRDSLSPEQRRVLGLWPAAIDRAGLLAAAERVRFQRGLSDKFQAGLQRAGAWREHIRSTLKELDVPLELAALPHVESSFNPRARSRVGAAGIWQFTASTGKQYLRVDQVVDERLDPFKSTVAAARLLAHNHRATGTWPLAITAYNHGASGMRRAVQQVGTTDIAAILRRYEGPGFKFASRNFYVALLAALEVEANAREYFPGLVEDPADTGLVVVTPAFLHIQTVERALGVDRQALKSRNLPLQPAVWEGKRYVPQGYELSLPPGLARDSAQARLERVPASERFLSQAPERYYTVRRGDVLSRIALRHDTSTGELMALNGLSRPRVRAGMVLQLPLVAAPVRPSRAAASTGVAAGGDLYTVQPGDSLASIVRRFGVSAENMLAMNGLQDAGRVQPGRVLRLSGASRVGGEQGPGPAPASAPGSGDDAGGEERAVAALAVAQEVPDPVPVAEDGAGDFGSTAQSDPSDYAVAPDGTVEVQAAETLGHFAGWLRQKVERLRVLNRLREGQALALGQRLRLDFSQVPAEAFERERTGYHRAMQEEFFAAHRITGACDHRVRPGESVWRLAQNTYGVPLWLLRQHNPDLDLEAVQPGATVVIPLIQRRQGAGGRTQPASGSC